MSAEEWPAVGQWVRLVRTQRWDPRHITGWEGRVVAHDRERERAVVALIGVVTPLELDPDMLRVIDAPTY